MLLLNVDESRLEYARLRGADDGLPTLVFLHHGLGCVELWHDFPAALSRATGCPAFVYSRLGYGHSDPLPKPWRKQVNYIQDDAIHTLPRVLQAADVNDMILVGHSDGASMALVYAATAAAGVRGVIVEAAHMNAEPETLQSIAEARTAYRNGDLRERLKKYHGENVDGAFYGWCESWLQPGYRTWSIEDHVPRVACPVLAIRGKGDVYGTQFQLERLSALARCPLKSLAPDCGHDPHIEEREEMLTAMSGFVADLIS